MGKKPSFVIGIDEVGRGPLAGPVVVGGVKLDRAFKIENLKLGKIRDSKKLTVKQREKWFGVLTNHPGIRWAVARVNPVTIDRVNIARATNIGVTRVYRKLAGSRAIPAMLDGGLRMSPDVPHIAIIRGDEKVPAISAASIIAKVVRDRLMVRLHTKYPLYRFDAHKGYGTRQHIELILLNGLSGIHRKSFCRSLRARC